MKIKKLAYSLAEIMVALGVTGILIGLLTTKVLRQSPDIEKTRVKKAYIAIEQTISSMINNDVLYPDDNMLKNLESVTTSVGDQFGVNSPNAKFREAFMYYLNIAEEGFSCEAFVNATASVDIDTCFMSSDGVVYAIPDTDFERTNVVPYKGTRVGAREHMYAPITVYPNFENKQNPQTDTMLVGVRYDGKIKILNNLENCLEDSTDISCKVLEFLHSDNIKKE